MNPKRQRLFYKKQNKSSRIITNKKDHLNKEEIDITDENPKVLISYNEKLHVDINETEKVDLTRNYQRIVEFDRCEDLNNQSKIYKIKEQLKKDYCVDSINLKLLDQLNTNKSSNVEKTINKSLDLTTKKDLPVKSVKSIDLLLTNKDLSIKSDSLVKSTNELEIKKDLSVTPLNYLNELKSKKELLVNSINDLKINVKLSDNSICDLDSEKKTSTNSIKKNDISSKSLEMTDKSSQKKSTSSIKKNDIASQSLEMTDGSSQKTLNQMDELKTSDISINESLLTDLIRNHKNSGLPITDKYSISVKSANSTNLELLNNLHSNVNVKDKNTTECNLDKDFTNNDNLEENKDVDLKSFRKSLSENVSSLKDIKNDLVDYNKSVNQDLVNGFYKSNDKKSKKLLSTDLITTLKDEKIDKSLIINKRLIDQILIKPNSFSQSDITVITDQKDITDKKDQKDKFQEKIEGSLYKNKVYNDSKEYRLKDNKLLDNTSDITLVTEKFSTFNNIINTPESVNQDLVSRFSNEITTGSCNGSFNNKNLKLKLKKDSVLAKSDAPKTSILSDGIKKKLTSTVLKSKNNPSTTKLQTKTNESTLEESYVLKSANSTVTKNDDNYSDKDDDRVFEDNFVVININEEENKALEKEIREEKTDYSMSGYTTSKMQYKISNDTLLEELNISNEEENPTSVKSIVKSVPKYNITFDNEIKINSTKLRPIKKIKSLPILNRKGLNIDKNPLKDYKNFEKLSNNITKNKELIKRIKEIALDKKKVSETMNKDDSVKNDKVEGKDINRTGNKLSNSLKIQSHSQKKVKELIKKYETSDLLDKRNKVSNNNKDTTKDGFKRDNNFDDIRKLFEKISTPKKE